MSLQNRLQAIERMGGGPMLAQYMIDLKEFEQDLGKHVVDAERILTEASKIAVASVDAYKKAGEFYMYIYFFFLCCLKRYVSFISKVKYGPYIPCRK